MTTNEHSIVLNAHEVRGLLDGRLTQLRRVMKDATADAVQFVKDNPTYPEYWNGKAAEPYTGWVVKYDALPIWLPRKCPYGQAGSKFWVRETWAASPFLNNIAACALSDYSLVVYRADNINESHFVFRPSIHMPRWASRINLEIVGVRAQRLQDMTEEDAMYEGNAFHQDQPSPRDEYSVIWENLNAKRGFGWDSNPWTWVLEVKKV